MSDIQPIVMPKWGLAMAEGTLVGWSVAEGASIQKGDEIAEIETTKITNVFESPVSGLLRRQTVKAGDIAPVGALLGVLAPSTVSDSDIDAFIGSFVVENADDGGSNVVEREARLDGRNIFYKINGSAQTGVPVVLIHGFGGDADNWLFNVEALAESRPVYTLDLPGHGKSTKTVARGDLDELADAVIAVLDDADVEKAHLVGHSLGGAVAFKILDKAPARVVSVAGVAPAGLGEEINDTYIQSFIAAEKRKDVRSALQMLVADPEQISATMIEGIQRFKRLEGVRDAIQAIAAKTLPNGRQAVSFRSLVEETDRPILVVWGEKDAIIDPRHADGLAGTISVARLPLAGHMPHLEAAKPFNERLAEHFANADAKAR
jgi:pyruvate dehydrogenase E2 component (dihydrolipoamide acetyltransferase)